MPAFIKDLAKRGEFVVAALCVLLVLVLLAGSDTFLSATNINSLQKSVAPSAIIAVGMLLLLVCGVFDLSVGSTMCLCAVVCVNTLDAGWPMAAGLALTAGTGMLVGAVNGFLVSYCGINPLIATIGMQYVAYGAAMNMGTLYQKTPSLPESFTLLGSGQALGVYWMVWILILVAAAFSFLLHRAPPGRQLYCIGGNRHAAEQMGFNAKRMIFGCYVVCGLLVAVAAALSVAYDGNASRYLGSGMELNVIIACILGGASLGGGKGTCVGAVLGVAAMSLITNAFNLLRVPSQWQNIVIGMLLVAVVASDGYLTLKKMRQAGRL